MEKKSGNPEVKAKMFKIAENLGQLNPKGFVKCRKENNHGYAQVVAIIKGCSIVVQHTFSNTITLNLFISQAAREKSPDKCDWAIKKFDQFFDFPVKKHDPYIIPSQPDANYISHEIDITKKENGEIFSLLKTIKDEILIVEKTKKSYQ